MNELIETWLPEEILEPPVVRSPVPGRIPLLSPYNAWRILKGRTGVDVGRSTFYRWVQDGKVFSMKIGGRIYIPWHDLEHVIRQFRNGVRV